MYIDPPYPQNGCNYKHNMQDWEDHRRLANRLSTTKCKWILSSYDISEVREMYEGFPIRTIQSFSGMKRKKNGSERVVNQEVVIANYDFESLGFVGCLFAQHDLTKGNASVVIPQTKYERSVKAKQLIKQSVQRPVLRLFAIVDQIAAQDEEIRPDFHIAYAGDDPAQIVGWTLFLELLFRTRHDMQIGQMYECQVRHECCAFPVWAIY